MKRLLERIGNRERREDPVSMDVIERRFPRGERFASNESWICVCGNETTDRICEQSGIMADGQHCPACTPSYQYVR